MPHLRAALPETGWAAVLAGAALILVLSVIAASAYVRLGTRAPTATVATIDAARTIRASAGLVAAVGIGALAIAAATVRVTRGTLAAGACSALALSITLSIVGFATGMAPPRWAAFTNQFGGVLLAGVLGWLAGRAASGIDAAAGDRRLAAAALIFCVLQAAFGGAIATSTQDPWTALVILHAAVGLATACCAAALAARLSGAKARSLRVALAAGVASVPLIGLASTLSSIPLSLQVAHALSGAALLACIAFATGRVGQRA